MADISLSLENLGVLLRLAGHEVYSKLDQQVSLPSETVQALLNAAGQRTISDLSDPRHPELNERPLTESMRSRACSQVGQAYTDAYTHG